MTDTKPTAAPLAHSSVMGGSNANKRINCPGSYELEAQMPEQPESPYATQGSVFHTAMEMLLTADPRNAKELKQVTDDLIGNDLGYGDEWAITVEQINTKILPAWDAWKTLVAEYDIDDYFIEVRVSLDTVIPKAFGTVDVLAKDTRKCLHVCDWKFGDGVPVPVEGNMQGLFYAGGALYDEDPEIKEFCEDVSAVAIHIVQPRVGDDSVLHTWVTDEATIEQFIDQAVAAHDQAIKPDAPIKAGGHCRWCKAKPICPAHTEAATDALSKSPEAMTSTQLSAALAQADLLKAWITDVYALAQRELEGGASVPGYKLVQKQPRRVWIDPEAAEKALRARKVKVGDMFKRTLLSPTQIQKAIPKVYESISDMVDLRSSGLTVVPDSDKREAVVDQFALLSDALPDGNSKQ